MSTALWLVLAGGAIGIGVAISGLIILVINRRRSDGGVRQRNVRTGPYALWFGTGLTLLSLSSLLNAFDLTVPALLVLAGSMTLVGVAVFRYRPRSDAAPNS